MQVFSLKNDGKKYVSKNFQVREFRCRDGSDPIFIDEKLVEILQAIRDWAAAPVTITSGYRTVSYNRGIKNSATYSQHIYGKAADIVVSGRTPILVAKFIETLLPNSGGIGIYSTFVHVDVREEKARWNG